MIILILAYISTNFMFIKVKEMHWTSVLPNKLSTSKIFFG